jgi:hypothetical protein
MSAWQEIVAAALVGTERNAPRFEPGGALGDLLRRLEAPEPERHLCHALAAAGLWQRAGRLPARDPQPLPDPCEADPLPACTPAAAHHLASMLAGTHAGALSEWLAAATKHGIRAPEALLREVLDLGLKHADLRPLVAQVAGARGRWLALRKPDWAYLVAETAPAEEVWQVGDRDARLAALARLRCDDPARARALLEESWPSEPPEQRAAFLGKLLDGLNMEDEPFLESLLDDRRKEVRQAAAHLLAALPESRLSRRMVERLRPLIRPGRRLLGFVLDVTPPEACDRAMARDGIDASQKWWAGAGDRALWLTAMLAASPPATWSEALGRPPADLARAARETSWKEALLTGWSSAAATHRDAAWAEALLREWLREPELMRKSAAWWGLFTAFSIEVAEALVTEMFRQERADLEAHPALLTLRAYPYPYGAALSRALLEQLRRAAAIGKPPDAVLRQLLQGAALRMAPEVAGEAVLGWPTDAAAWSVWEAPVNEFLATLTFRRDMLKELSS